MGRKQYFTLDGMRGIAALAVVLFHSGALIGVQLAPSGYLAVDLFFVLSGFVIAHAYEEKLLDGLGFGEFLKARVVRFYPLFALGLLIGLAKCLAVLVLHIDSDMPPARIVPAFLAELFFLPAPIVGPDFNVYPLNVPAWSLGLELVVNAVYALSVRRLSNRVLWCVAAVSGVLFAASVLQSGKADLGAWLSHYPAPLARTVFSFTAGVLVYRHRNMMSPNSVPAWILLPIVALCLLLPADPARRAAYDVFFIGLISPALVMLGASLQPSTRMTPLFTYLGIISFPIYAVHYGLLKLALGVESIIGHGAVLGGLLFAGLFVGGWVLDRFYDRPVRRWILALRAPGIASAKA